MKILYASILALVAFGAGVAASRAWDGYNLSNVDDPQPEGTQLKCVAHGRICVGSSAKQAIYVAEETLGQLTTVYCGFDRPTVNVKEELLLDEVIVRGCSDPRYMAGFSDGKGLTNLWIENGKVIQLSRFPAHKMDM